MGVAKNIIKDLFKAVDEAKMVKAAEPVAKEVEATRPWRELTSSEKTAAREASRPRIGVPQRELSALKQQTIRRSGEQGYRSMAGEFRAQLQEGGEFPLRSSVAPKPTGGGELRFPERDIFGQPPSAERRAEIVSGIAERARPGSLQSEEFDLSKYEKGLREHVAERATGRELSARSAVSGTVPTGREAESATRAARVAVETGQSRRGFGNISAGVSPSGAPKDALSDADKLRRGIQSGAIRAAAVGGAGYAAQGWGDTARDLYTGPDNSHRTPTVQWGRNRQ